MKAVAFLALALPITLVGCGAAPDPDEGSGPPKVEFTGKVDPALAGTWQTAKKDSILTLGVDGGLKVDSTFNTPKGPGRASHNGQWLVGDGKLRLRYRENDGSDTTIAYGLKVKGKEMTLSTKVPKLDTVYTKS